MTIKNKLDLLKKLAKSGVDEDIQTTIQELVMENLQLKENLKISSVHQIKAKENLISMSELEMENHTDITLFKTLCAQAKDSINNSLEIT